MASCYQPDEPSTFNIISKRNYKVYANVGEYSKISRCFSAILDIGVDSSFIRLSEPPMKMRNCIKPLYGDITIRCASAKTVPVVDTTELVFYLITSKATVNFLVAKQLAI